MDRPETSAAPGTRWLSAAEDEAWRSVWAMMTWLPVRLDAQLKADAGLSLAEYSALSQLSEAPGRSLRLSELAVGANMSLSHLSRVMSRMERLGWAQRSPDPADGRFTLGRLTEEGWARVVSAAPAHVETVHRAVFDVLTPEQLETFGEAMGLIAEAVTPARTARQRPSA